MTIFAFLTQVPSLIEYRGTQVAVKRVIPPKSRVAFESSFHYFDRQDKTDPTGEESLEHQSGDNPGLRTGYSKSTDLESAGKDSWEHLRMNFVEEMRILSKLRHPCICTVMGKTVEP